MINVEYHMCMNTPQKKEYNRIYREAHREQAKLYARNFRKERRSTRDKERQKRVIAKWKEKNPEKREAHYQVLRAIKKGLLIRKPCLKCGVKKVHAHHEDYSKPLEVLWLCPIHHWEFDNARRQKEKTSIL